jgi:hypothetical protein
MRLLIAVASLLLVAACGHDSPDTAQDPGPTAPALPTAIPAADGPVTGLGLVLDNGKPGFCLGPVAESYPPQCTGLAMTGWDWSEHRGAFDDANGVRFGSFAVTGTFDGETLDAQSAVSGAVYDPMPWPQPTSSAAENHTQAQLDAIAEQLVDLPGALSTTTGDNLVVVDVIHDDGSLQAWADSRFGDGLVFVHPMLAPAAG